MRSTQNSQQPPERLKDESVQSGSGTRGFCDQVKAGAAPPQVTTPWSTGPRGDGLWICPEDQARIDRYNATLPNDDGRRLAYTAADGTPIFPCQFAGNPRDARLLLLMLNPSPGGSGLANMRTDMPGAHLVEAAVRGNFDAEYPNPWLRPELRTIDTWYTDIVFRELHRHLTELGVHPEDAWKRLAQRCCVLELSPWASLKWSHGAMVSTCRAAVDWAASAAADPQRTVLLARGEADWRTAGFWDVDTVPRTRGIRQHQSRITRNNYPGAWEKILASVT